MILEHVPLLQIARELYGCPRGYARFQEYLRTMFNVEGEGMLTPMVGLNPMAKEHVPALLDELLALNAESVAARAIAEAQPRVADVPGCYKVGLTVGDDRGGGWTNRVASEFASRFGSDALARRGWTAELRETGETPVAWRRWISVFLWSSEPPSAAAVREAVLTSIYRVAYAHRHGRAATLRQKMAQEGHVLAEAGCTRPALDPDDREYTRAVLAPLLEETDERVSMECLFGDDPCRSLGFTPRGLSPLAGLALALHDAQVAAPSGA